MTIRTTTSTALAILLAGLLAAGCNSGSRPSSASSSAAGVTSGANNPAGQTFRLLSSTAGTGTGTVTIDPASANNEYPAGTSLRLSANEDPGSVFVEWGGDFAGVTTYDLSVVLNNDVTVQPVFDTPAAGSPTGAFTVNPDPAMWIAPLPVTFTDASTGAPTRWEWDFGDGNVSTSQNPSHTYTSPGVYTVRLRVWNAQGVGLPAVQTDVVYVAPPDEGSRFWYENDRYGMPFQAHSAAEDGLAQQVLALVNQERAAVGVAPLMYDAEAERAAKAHSEDMRARGYFDHDTPEGWSPGDRLRMTGASGYQGYGENIAMGQATPAAVMQAWMNSAGHRANILDPNFTHLGVGVGDGPLWTQVFLAR